MQDTVEREVVAVRARAFVVGTALVCLVFTYELVELLPAASTAVVLLRSAVVLAFAVAGGAVVAGWTRPEVGERIAWAAAVAYCIVDVQTLVLPEVGPGIEASLSVVVLHLVVLLVTYMVWPLGTARWLVGAVSVLGAIALAQTLAGHPDVEAAVRVASFLPISLVICEAFVARARVLADVAARAAAEADLGRTDQLTGLRNRRGLLPRLEELEPGDAVVLVDVDHFKRVNDVHGHDVGDAVLRRVAATIAGAARAEDAVGRWGGEEFVVVTGRRGPHVGRHHDAGRRLGEELCDAVRADDAEPEVTVSAGVAVVQPGDEGWQDALRRADARLYAAKAAGRDRVVASPDEPISTSRP